MLRELARRGTTSVLVEGGAALIGSLRAHGRVDQALVFVRPAVLGDERSLGAVRGLQADRIADGRRLELRQATPIDGDILLDYRV